jgi:uroporphyrinogen-III synthase
VIIPNQNSVDAILDSFDSSQLNFKNIYCIGRRTKRLIEKTIGKVTHSENSEEKLSKYLADHLPVDSSTTYFCGNRRSNMLPNHLTKNKKDLNEIVCYKTILSSNKIEENINAIIFYSPLDIESYLQQNTATDTPVFCVGETTTLEAKNHFKIITTAKIPTVESVLRSVNEFFTDH